MSPGEAIEPSHELKLDPWWRAVGVPGQIQAVEQSEVELVEGQAWPLD